jgi:hypothetical protein
MSALTPEVARPRKRRRVAALAVTAAIAVAGLAVATDAHAESGRRICEYSFKARPEKSDKFLENVSLGLDYKADGECPWLSPDKLALTGLVDRSQIFPNPVHKWTCEDWGSTHQTALIPNLGADPCPKLPDDHLIAFYWMDPTLPNPDLPHYQDLGYYTYFQ